MWTKSWRCIRNIFQKWKHLVWPKKMRVGWCRSACTFLEDIFLKVKIEGWVHKRFSMFFFLIHFYPRLFGSKTSLGRIWFDTYRFLRLVGRSVKMYTLWAGQGSKWSVMVWKVLFVKCGFQKTQQSVSIMQRGGLKLRSTQEWAFQKGLNQQKSCSSPGSATGFPFFLMDGYPLLPENYHVKKQSTANRRELDGGFIFV